MFSAAAVAKIYSDDIEALAKTFFRRRQHVDRRARTFDAVPRDYGRVLVAIRLPTAMGQHLHSRRHIKVAFLIYVRMKTKPAWPGVSGEGLRVTVLKKPVRLERLAREAATNAFEKRASLGGVRAGDDLPRWWYFDVG